MTENEAIDMVEKFLSCKGGYPLWRSVFGDVRNEHIILCCEKWCAEIEKRYSIPSYKTYKELGSEM